MSRSRFSRFCAMALVAVAGTAMVGASFDAEARRMGGGSSFGRQSTNITQQRQAVTPPAAGAGTTAGATSAARPATAAAGTAAAGTAAKSGMSRWLGPIAGIAAGLGLAALLSHLGLSGAFAEFMASMLLIALVVFAVIFIVRPPQRQPRCPRPATTATGSSRVISTRRVSCSKPRTSSCASRASGTAARSKACATS